MSGRIRSPDLDDQTILGEGEGDTDAHGSNKKVGGVRTIPACTKPMYTGVFLALYGEGIMLGSTAILVFAITFTLLPLLYVPLVEERGLEKRFGEEYQIYKAHVPRWVPRLNPWEGGA